ncbi:hypothetical protein [Mycolicibacterium litorale]|nr:hypothetical protein [Mycolicibacterium litorale]
MLPETHNPLMRIDAAAKKPGLDIDDLIDMWQQWVEDILFPIIENITGIDLSVFLPFINGVVDNLQVLFGSLNPLDGDFNPLNAINAFINVMTEFGVHLPMILFQELQGFVAGVPILNQLVAAITGGISGGLDDLAAWAAPLTDLVENFLQQVADAIQGILGGVFGGLNFGDLPAPGEVWNHVFGNVVNPGAIPQNIVSGLQGALAGLNGFIQDVVDAIISAIRGIPFVGGGLADILSEVTGLRQTAVTAETKSNQIEADAAAAWTGTGPPPGATAVYGVIGGVRSALLGQYLVEVLNASGTWTKPATLVGDVTAICLAGGGMGRLGETGTSANVLYDGGQGGQAGGLSATVIPSGDLPATVSYLVGAPATSPGQRGGDTSFGTFVVSEGGRQGSVEIGFVPVQTSGDTGDGGTGGDARNNLGGSGGQPNLATDGEPGDSTAVALGGKGGVGRVSNSTNGNPGQPGADINLAERKKGGGGGGGGGGGSSGIRIGGTVFGARGGAGGWPGGASGGSGAAVNSSLGSAVSLMPNPPAPGAIFLIYRLAEAV